LEAEEQQENPEQALQPKKEPEVPQEAKQEDSQNDIQPEGGVEDETGDDGGTVEENDEGSTDDDVEDEEGIKSVKNNPMREVREKNKRLEEEVAALKAKLLESEGVQEYDLDKLLPFNYQERMPEDSDPDIEFDPDKYRIRLNEYLQKREDALRAHLNNPARERLKSDLSRLTEVERKIRYSGDIELVKKIKELPFIPKIAIIGTINDPDLIISFLKEHGVSESVEQTIKDAMSFKVRKEIEGERLRPPQQLNNVGAAKKSKPIQAAKLASSSSEKEELEKLRKKRSITDEELSRMLELEDKLS
jgi:hypothetical protein